MANLTRETFGRIAEALGCTSMFDLSEGTIIRRPNGEGYYTGPTDAAEFWCAVEEVFRSALRDSQSICRAFDRSLNEFHISSKTALSPIDWYIRECTTLQRIEALAAALGVEVEKEADNG